MVLPEIKISVFGGENGRKPEDSGYKPGYSGFGTLRGKTPGINPDTLENSGNSGLKSGYSGFCRSVGVGLARVVVRVYGLGVFQSYKSYCMPSLVICIRVDAAAEGAVYEVIAGPQEQQGQVQ